MCSRILDTTFISWKCKSLSGFSFNSCSNADSTRCHCSNRDSTPTCSQVEYEPCFVPSFFIYACMWLRVIGSQKDTFSVRCKGDVAVTALCYIYGANVNWFCLISYLIPQIKISYILKKTILGTTIQMLEPWPQTWFKFYETLSRLSYPKPGLFLRTL